MGQSRMDIPETLATLATQDTRRLQTNKNTIQKTTTMSNTYPAMSGDEPICHRRESSSCLDTRRVTYKNI